MKKVQTLALALALIALGSVSWAVTSLNSFRSMQKKPPETEATNLNSSRSNIYRVKVTKVNPKDKTFAVEVTFSAQNLKDPLPEVGKIIDVTFTQTTPGGSLEAVKLNSSKSNIY